MTCLTPAVFDESLLHLCQFSGSLGLRRNLILSVVNTLVSHLYITHICMNPIMQSVYDDIQLAFRIFWTSLKIHLNNTNMLRGISDVYGKT